MKKLLLFFLSVLFLFTLSCKESKKKDKKSKQRKTLVSSSGTINSLSIIIDDSLWKNEVGESLREVLTKPVTGLPQEEPLFSLNHIPPAAFSGFTRTRRIFIKIEGKEKPHFEMVKDSFASPQVGFVIGEPDTKTITDLIEENSREIIATFKKTESKANVQRISKSLKSSKTLEETFGLNLKFPSVYRYAVEEEDFVWIRKDISHGSMEILVYEVPLKAIEKDSNVVKNIIKMRDSIGQKYIPGPHEGSYMVTEKAYSPYLYETKIDGKFTYLTKGTWEVEGAWMAGPFVNYAVRDEKNDRYLILEGFVFKPQSPNKRDNIFELQAIFNSAKIK